MLTSRGLFYRTGASGVLLVKGPGVMAGYMQDPVATSAAIDKDGYFDTGDLAKVR